MGGDTQNMDPAGRCSTTAKQYNRANAIVSTPKKHNNVPVTPRTTIRTADEAQVRYWSERWGRCPL